MEQLVYRRGDRYRSNNPVQHITAERFFQVRDGKLQHMEGMAFDRNGDLYFVMNYEGAVMRLDMKKMELHEVYKDTERLRLGAVKIHKDGRLFLCGLSMHGKPGGLFTVNPDGTNFQTVLPGVCVDDLCFDSKGGFYYTVMTGTLDDRSGGIYYMSPDLTTITPVVRNLASANGVALSTDEKVLWYTEMWTNQLHRVPLDNPGYAQVVHQFEGTICPDSCEIDADDNLYVAYNGAGQFLVFNPLGILIATVDMPGREEGRNLCSTHAIIRPGTNELYMTACDDLFDDGAAIFRAGVFAKAPENAFHLT